MLARFGHLKKSEVPLHRAIISDIVLWVSLALGLSLAVYWLAIRMPEQDGQHILLKFRDANQITRGSAVTMLGTDVGYVKDIRIHQDHVDVQVQTFSKSLSIPSGATFTVLFNGLAGSKSIDIELPRMPMPEMDGKPIYTVAEPVRLNTLLDYMVDMTQALTVGAENIADFFGRKKPVEELQFNIRQAHEWSLDSLTYVDLLEQSMSEFQRDLHTNVGNGVNTLAGFNRRAQFFIRESDPALIRPQVVSALQTIRNIREQLNPPPGKPGITQRLQRWNASTVQFGGWAHRMNLRVQDFPLSHILDRIETGEDQFIATLDQIQAFFECHDKQKLQELRRNIQTFNRHVLSLSLKLDGKSSASAAPQQSPYTPCCPPLKPYQRPPIKTQRPGSAQAVKPFPIVDRGGHPQKHPNAWWDKHPAAQREVAAAPQTGEKYIPAEAKEEETQPALFVPLLQGMNNFVSVVWDSLVAFFTS